MAEWYMIEKRLSGWSEYLEEARCLVRSYGDLHKPPLFRGHARSDWRLETSLERDYPDVRSFLAYYCKVSASKGAVEMLTGRRWDNVPDYGELREMAGTDLDRLTTILTGQQEIMEFLLYLRHHKFPSPLLDWTASPYVAAFFAFEAPESAKEVRVFAFVPAKSGGIFTSERCVHLVGHYGRSHVRHVYQQSWYTMCIKKEPSDYLIQCHDDKVMTEAAEQGRFLQFTIPASERLVALKELQLMNVNAFSLFGSEDSLIRTLAAREFLLSSGI
ncbi:MAG: FRG domain-containing protein [Bryobacteraceae bacterium]